MNSNFHLTKLNIMVAAYFIPQLNQIADDKADGLLFYKSENDAENVEDRAHFGLCARTNSCEWHRSYTFRERMTRHEKLDL